MLSILSDTLKVVVDTVTMRSLKNAGFEMSKPTYYRQKENRNFEVWTNEIHSVTLPGTTHRKNRQNRINRKHDAEEFSQGNEPQQ
jgi:hypothetical protein